MNFQFLDWVVLVSTLLLVIGYGIYKSNAGKNLEGYYLGNRQMPWWLVLLSIMGTQASAITFLTAPGQAYTDGMRFIQYYFGLPLAMIVIAIVFVPIFNRLHIYTAYEFLEKRFDLKTRTLTSFLFLLSRGLSTGISIFAPSMILHSMLGWDIYWTNIFMGGLLIIYTVTGGAKAVAYTQQIQFVIIYVSMFIAGYYAIAYLPHGFDFTNALHVAGKSGKLNIITDGFENGVFNWKDKYNIWSGLIGGFFLALSYFGTDQSQVGRYITAKNSNESRKGLLINGFVKIPLQFLILLLGCLVFSYYIFADAPAFFNNKLEAQVYQSAYRHQYQDLQNAFIKNQEFKKHTALELKEALSENDYQKIYHTRLSLRSAEEKSKHIRSEIKKVVNLAVPNADTNDTNYIFLRFVSDTMPVGLIGLIIAVIFLAAWGSIAAALHSLSSCTMVDFHQRIFQKDMSEKSAYRWGRFYTVIWGVICILVAEFSYNMGNSLIEAVNILGSWFYGTILGIFLVGFFVKFVKGNAVFWAAIISEGLVLMIYYMDVMSFLWLNVIGAVAVVMISILFSLLQKFRPSNNHVVW
ncbi:MAG: sodium:solute symporter [Bacteroidota bacterium]